jgi:hypothetical protein
LRSVSRESKAQMRGDRSDRGYKHALMFSAVELAVKPAADKAGAFVLPLSREPHSNRSTWADKHGWFVFRRIWQEYKHRPLVSFD